jgi:GntR family transcriptional regulator, transcriptional repressor for pyruvate dehydrogenase complex
MIAAELRRRITAGELRPGQRLPGHRELASGFAVSVGSVREAISMLVSAGLIETRAARGTFVVDATELSRADGSPLEGSEAEELIEARTLLEGEIAALAAERASPADIERLRQAVSIMNESAGEAAAYTDADIAFHLAVAHAGGNRFLERALEGIWSRLRHDMQLSAETAIRRFGNLGFSVPAHEELVQAIETHDAAEARRIALEFMQRSREFVLGLYALRPPQTTR